MESPCPICKEKKFRRLYAVQSIRKEEFELATCNACGHTFTLISPEIDLESYYYEGGYKIVDVRGSIFFRILSIEYSKILNELKKLRPNSKLLLDFGCGKGNFLSFAKNKGWIVTGVETSIPRADYARAIFGLKIFTEHYSKGKIGTELYDVITLIHVLEHLPAPKELLQELIMNNLNKDGLVLIEVPNLASIQSRLSKNKWIHLDVPIHRSHFSETTLNQMLLSLNLRVVRREYFSFHHGVLGMVQSTLSVFGYKENLFLKLKYNKTIGTISLILLTLPIAVIMEILASTFKRGGVLRFYATPIR